MTYRVRITDTARQEIRQCPGHVRQRVRRMIDSFVENPFPPRAKQLRGLPGRYRVPLLDWRIIYRVDQQALVLSVRRKRSPQTYQDIK